MKTRNFLNLATLTLTIASCGSKTSVNSTLPNMPNIPTPQDLKPEYDAGKELENKEKELEKQAQELDKQAKKFEKQAQELDKQAQELEAKKAELEQKINKQNDELLELDNKINAESDPDKKEELEQQKRELEAEKQKAEAAAAKAEEEKRIAAIEKEILVKLKDPTNTEYNTLQTISREKEAGKPIVKIERKDGKFSYEVLSIVGKDNFKFTDDDFKVYANNNKIATKEQKTKTTKTFFCVAGDKHNCDESKVDDIKAALTKYKTATDLTTLSPEETKYICSMQQGACKNDNGQQKLEKTYNNLTKKNKEDLTLYEKILNEGKRKVEINYDLSVKGIMTRGGNAVKLSYADFGMYEENLEIKNVTNDIPDPELNALYNKKNSNGSRNVAFFTTGIDRLKAGVRAGSKDMTFTGKTFAELKKRNNNNESSKILNDSAKLTIDGAAVTGDLEFGFGDALNLKANNLDLTKNKFDKDYLNGKITATGTEGDGYSYNQTNETHLNLNMYGPETNRPTEAVGSYRFSFQKDCMGGSNCSSMDLRGVFGMKKD